MGPIDNSDWLTLTSLKTKLIKQLNCTGFSHTQARNVPEEA